MEFSEKLQQLRKQRALTQEQLAAAIFVSRTAVSKWESGRGLPEIGSLRALAAFFGVSVDELLSPSEALEIGAEEAAQKRERLCDLTYGLLDVSMILLLFFPLFRGVAADTVAAQSLLTLMGVSPLLRALYIAFVNAMAGCGILTLSLQGMAASFWQKIKYKLSLALSVLAMLFFVLGMHPYATVFAFFLLLIKALILQKAH